MESLNEMKSIIPIILTLGNIEPQSDDMVIKIQTFESITPLSIKRSASVQDLKDKIYEVRNFNFRVLTCQCPNRD